jgi:general secretion pathway protein N
MNKKSKQMTWWITGVVAFLIFVLLQVPATWLIAKFYKNNQTLHNVSGNIWQGQADWHKGNLRGSVSWRTRPWDLILLRVGANVEVHSGQTQLNGVVGYGLGKKIIVNQMQGQIAPETLKNIANWQWPANAIQISDMSLRFKKDTGFSDVDGQLHWAGGELRYTFGQRQDQMNIPSLNAQLKDEAGKLIFDIQDQRSQKMANISLDPSMMLDVQLTQRMLLTVPSYDGKAGLDPFVISSRQPLIQGGF